MYTIIDYLNYYKDTTIKYVKLNEQDFLLFSILSYLPVDSFFQQKNLSDFIKYAFRYQKRGKGSVTIASAYQLLKLISSSKRYQDVRVEKFYQFEDESSQFGAATFSLGKNKIISFNGSNRSFVSWMENARIFYQYPTHTQKSAIDYLRENIDISDDNVYVVGHSKGGNLAMVSAMELERSLFKKVKQIYNFDGPGLLREQYTLYYKKIAKKLVTVIPSNSMVGVLLYNDHFKVIKSKNHLIETHYPSSWCVFGQFFQLDSLKVFSSQLHNYTTFTLEKIDRKLLGDTLESLFKEGIKDGTDDISFNTLREGLLRIKEADPQVFRYLNTLLTSLITVNKK